MILSQVSSLDIIVFLLILTPQLLIHVGLWPTIKCAASALPFFLVQLPFQFIQERFCTPKSCRPPFVQRSSAFEDVVIRCVRYAFANVPSAVGRVFFSKAVSRPFLRFRMLRHGYWRSPIYWREVSSNGVNGIWIVANEHQSPDLIIYYCHGGGFAMGSSWFYLEFLLALVHILRTGPSMPFRNPALFALEYTLVPEAAYPTQMQQSIAGYLHLLSILPDPSRICLAGDSAGATLCLSLLLHLSRERHPHWQRNLRPGFATLISPWVVLVSPRNKNTLSDYLDADTLEMYARQYARSDATLQDPVASPGTCKDAEWWRRAVPRNGLAVFVGSEEVFATEATELVAFLREAGIPAMIRKEEGSIHAWPVASMFLSGASEKRLRGLNEIASLIAKRIG